MEWLEANRVLAIVRYTRLLLSPGCGFRTALLGLHGRRMALLRYKAELLVSGRLLLVLRLVGATSEEDYVAAGAATENRVRRALQSTAVMRIPFPFAERGRGSSG